MAETTKKVKASSKAKKVESEKAQPVKKSAAKNKTGIAIEAAAASVPIRHEEVALLAHRFWAERGHQHGKHVDDWFRAEQELRGKAS